LLSKCLSVRQMHAL